MLLELMLGGVGLLNTAILVIFAPLLKHMLETKRSVAEIKHEVKNDHSTNLREEQDARHAEQMESNFAIYQTLNGHGQQLMGLQNSVQGLSNQLNSVDTRVVDLEDTLVPKEDNA